MQPQRFPEMHDLVSITEKSVEYYGYIDDIDFDVRNLSVCIEFFPGSRKWFDMKDIKFVKFPESL